MAKTIDIGSSALEAAAAPDFVSVYIPADAVGTTITVNSGDTLNYFTSLDASAAGTITAGNNQTFTVSPLWVTSNSISNVTFSGGGY